MINGVGRDIPKEIKGYGKVRPFKSSFGYVPKGNNYGRVRKKIKPGENKLIELEDAVKKYVKNGMTISFHHAFRNGDIMVNRVLDICSDHGLKNLRLFPSALFPCHEPVIEHIKNGVVNRIEGSMNGPVGYAVSHGILDEPGVLRSHGNRYRTVEAGEVHIDVAFIVAPTADRYGNANGIYGPTPCGPLVYPLADSLYADKVIVITNNLVEYPALPMTISQTNVDHVVVEDNIGDPAGIVSGTLRITRSPRRLKIARTVVDVIKASGAFKDGFNFQAGAGGISLAATKFIGEALDEEDIVGGFACGGTTKYLVDILEKGRVRCIVDGQSFGLEAIDSIRKNPNHYIMTPNGYANYNSRGCVVYQEDAAFLGATEVDTKFNVNVNTHSDGLLLHGIGGHQDVAAGVKMSIITTPLLRGRIPVVVKDVTTVTAPGQDVDVVVTDVGVAVNPRRKNLKKKLEASDVEVRDIKELQEEAYGIAGEPEEPETTDKIIGVIQYRDGSVIDIVKEVKE
ncbi:MAG: citrate lyase subunit alpha [Euryarchaeota archaeon]|nr:citrate lyase subunit alpha [Euryarchaeota archaeon]